MKENISAKERLIVALDVDTNDQALEIVNKIGNDVTYYKVGLQLSFARGEGVFALIRKLADKGKKIFLDLKIGDIGTTIEKALQNAPDEFVEFVELFTLSGTGASELVQAAKRGTTRSNLKLLMLTALSSMDDKDIKEVYGENADIDKVIRYNTKTALNAGSHGVIASGKSIEDLRKEFGNDFIIVAPGIRPEGSPANDHKRSLTPYEAITYGADYLVVGRPITQSDDPEGTAKQIISEIQMALNDLEISEPLGFAHPQVINKQARSESNGYKEKCR